MTACIFAATTCPPFDGLSCKLLARRTDSLFITNKHEAINWKVVKRKERQEEVRKETARRGEERSKETRQGKEKQETHKLEDSTINIGG